MLDLDAQIREYLEAVSAPLTVEDILETPIGEGMVRPLTPQPALRRLGRSWQVMVAAAVIVLVAVGGVAWLVASRSDVEPAEPAPTTTVPGPTTTVPGPTTTVPADLDLGAAHDVVFDAFTAIGDTDWMRFLGHLDPDGVIRDGTTGSVHPWWVSDTDEIPVVQFPPDFDLDYDGDGRFTRAEQLLTSAFYLALAPIEILGCEPAGAAVTCLVHDSSPLHRAAGAELGPIPVTVRDGKIVEIQVASVFSEAGDAIVIPQWSLGGCDRCDPESVWYDSPYETWIRSVVGTSGESLDRLLFSEYGMSSRSGFSTPAWINPGTFDEHRRLIPQWLSSLTGDNPLRALVETYVTGVSAPAPEPAFDTGTLGSEQPSRANPDADILDMPWIFDPAAAAPYWLSAVELPGGQIRAFYWFDVIDAEETGLYYIDGLHLHVDAGTRGGVGDAGSDVGDSVAPLVTALLISGIDDDTGERTFQVAVGGLPAEASVVALTLDSGTGQWQRPVAGVVLFDATERPGGPLRVLDAAGDELFRVEVNSNGDSRIIPPNDASG